MKMKLAALLAATMLTLAGCGSSSNSTNTTNSSNTSNKAGNTTSSTTATPDPNMIKANANASDETGGTKEGCKCSAVGMKCSTKAGEKGCCGKDECSTMVDGKSSCCAGKGSENAACCSTSGKVAMGEKTSDKMDDKMDDKNACNPAEKPATAPAGKKG
ncbi:MAG TPA: hypothetical protein VF779_12835 [Pyrinomonadaceae bacterium]